MGTPRRGWPAPAPCRWGLVVRFGRHPARHSLGPAASLPGRNACLHARGPRPRDRADRAGQARRQRALLHPPISVPRGHAHRGVPYTRQTLAYPSPTFSINGERAWQAHVTRAAQRGGPFPGDAEIPGGRFLLGALPGEPFVFDNEKWAHPIDVKPFAIARAAVTQAEFAAFVEDQGYQRRELWSEEGWRWRENAAAEHPVYWKREGSGRWLRRDFNCWAALEPHRPVLHVNWWEAEAYCRWAGRRLPNEAEWEVAASAEPAAGGGLAQVKHRFPWGDDPPTPDRANLGWRELGTVDVSKCAEGDSAFGCRQMIGNVWEWTSSDFGPYPGFVIDPYKEYSQPWFGTHKVLRGGAWTTQPRLLRNTWRNFYPPHRRDVWAGFRTCRSI